MSGSGVDSPDALVIQASARVYPFPFGWVWHQTSPLGMIIVHHYGGWATFVTSGDTNPDFLAPHTVLALAVGHVSSHDVMCFEG